MDTSKYHFVILSTSPSAKKHSKLATSAARAHAARKSGARHQRPGEQVAVSSPGDTHYLKLSPVVDDEQRRIASPKGWSQIDPTTSFHAPGLTWALDSLKNGKGGRPPKDILLEPDAPLAKAQYAREGTTPSKASSAAVQHSTSSMSPTHGSDTKVIQHRRPDS